MPEATKNCSITEVELCGLVINIVIHLLLKHDFDAVVDHLALVYILKSKTEPPTSRIKKLLDILSAYSSNF